MAEPVILFTSLGICIGLALLATFLAIRRLEQALSVYDRRHVDAANC